MKYRLDFADEIVDIGVPGDFVPVLNLRKWGEEARVSLRLQTNDKKEPSFNAGRYRWAGKELELLWYPTVFQGIKSIENEIVFSKKPVSNRINFEVDLSGVTVHPQPPLTREVPIGYRGIVTSVTETTAYDARGNIVSHRPEHVVDSLVFMRVGHTGIYRGHATAEKYQAGIAGHLFRPKLRDALGNESWCSMSLKDGLLTIEMDSAYLDAAIYPVILDPTWGYTTVGGSYETWSNYTVVGSNNSPADIETATSMTMKAYLRVHSSGTFHYKGTIWTTGYNGAFVSPAGAPATISSTTAAWYDSAFGSLPGVSNSTNYNIGPILDGGATARTYYNSGGQAYYSHAPNYASPSGNLDGSSRAWYVSAYIEYEAGGGWGGEYCGVAVAEFDGVIPEEMDGV